jgi:hypothetical protein
MCMYLSGWWVSQGSEVLGVEDPRTSKHSHARDISWAYEPMFDGSISPKNLMQMFEYLPVVRSFQAGPTSAELGWAPG